MEHLGFLLKVGDPPGESSPLERPHLEQKQLLFPESCSTSSSLGAVVLRLWRTRRCLLNIPPALPESLWSGGVQQWALLGKIPHLHLALGSGWGFICCWEDLNWESDGSSMGLAIASCEFVQPFAIQACTGTCDQSLEVGKWDGLSHRAKPPPKPPLPCGWG